MVWELRRMPDFFKMTPDDVIATLLQYEEHLKESKRLLATYGGPSSNLSLKARLKEIDDDEEDCEYEEDDNYDDMPSYEDMALFVKRFSKGDFKGKFQKKKTRACYNCERPGHFAEDCPYEKREDRPRFPRKEVSKKLPNPLNEKPKKTAFVSLEESDPEDVGGVAGVSSRYTKDLEDPQQER